VATSRHVIGSGLAALLSMSPAGPSAVFQASGEEGLMPGLMVDRKHPKLPEKAGFLAEIVNPNSSAPKFRWNMEGGGHPASTTAFPRLPKGCALTYRTDDAGDTYVIPKGGVAAGYQATGGGVSPLVEFGGAAAALAAAGVAFTVLRPRKATGR
jgi:hypothetical protein